MDKERPIMQSINDSWNSGDPYDYFMGRWSTRMAPAFLDWFGARPGGTWLDLGCGTGALSYYVLEMKRPRSLTSMDPSPEFLQQAKLKLSGPVNFLHAGAERIPLPDGSFDVLVSGLALNFIPDLKSALLEIKRVMKPKGIVGAYVWDYAGRMEMLRMFWDAAAELNPRARKLDEGVRFSHCSKAGLISGFKEAGFEDIRSELIDTDTLFENFDDYWHPFLSKIGPAPGYVATLTEIERQQLQQRLEQILPVRSDGSILLTAGAIAIKGTKTN